MTVSMEVNYRNLVKMTVMYGLVEMSNHIRTCRNCNTVACLHGKRNDKMWNKCNYCELYSNKTTERTRRRDPYQTELLKDLKSYAETLNVVAEFPSLKYVYP